MSSTTTAFIAAVLTAFSFALFKLRGYLRQQIKLQKFGLASYKATLDRQNDILALQRATLDRQNDSLALQNATRDVQNDILALQRFSRDWQTEMRALQTASMDLLGALRRETQQQTIASQTLVFHRNEFVRAHLSALADATARSAGPDEISYSLERFVREIEIERHGHTKTVICSLALGSGYRDIVAPCLDSHRRFAEKLGLTYAVMTTEPIDMSRPPSWFKLPLLARLIRDGADQILLIDADAMITNPAFDIEAQFARLDESGKTMLLAEDEGGVNFGVVFIKGTPTAIRMLDMTWLYDAEIDHPNWEQHAFKYLMRCFPAFRARVMTDHNAKLFNSFAPERSKWYRTYDRNVWSEGDFVCHFAGIRGDDLKAIIQDYARHHAT